MPPLASGPATPPSCTPPWEAASEGATESGAAPAPSFESLVAQLREAHELQIQELRQEIRRLRGEDGASEVEGPREIDPDRDLGPIASPSVPPSPVQCSAEPMSVPRVTFETAPSRCRSGSSVGGAPSRCRSGSSVGGATDSRASSWVRLPSLFERMEPKCLDLQKLCVERYYDRRWEDLDFHKRVGLIREALRPKHWLINPHCGFMKFWDTTIALSLIFIGLVTPYEVVFISGMDWGLFVINRVVDAQFAADILLQFFLIAEVERPHRGGTVLLRHPRKLRMRYLKSWFIVDFVSILPFELVSMLLASSSVFWQRAKILRCLKLLRIIRLLRMVRSSKILQRWKNSIAVPFHTQKLLRCFVVLTFVSHWMACLWGIAGLTFGADLCDERGELVSFGSAGVGVQDASWVTTLYVGGKSSPDSPCNHLEVYIASLHWAVMTLTSIGYGDIVPVRSEEYVVAILCMLAGGVLWAYVIGSLCSIISNLNPLERAFEANTDLLNEAMSEALVPYQERPKYREFLREAKAYNQRRSFSHVADSFSPMLRRQLMYHVEKDSLSAVYYFKGPNTPLSFCMDISSRLTPKLFSRGESMDILQHCLCLMDRGTVAHGRRILVRPSVFHEDFIITQHRYQLYIRTTSLTYAQVLTLTREHMEEALVHYPLLERRIRVCAAKTAFLRAVRLASAAYKGWRTKAPIGRALTLSQAFDKTRTDFGFEMFGAP